MTSRQPTTLPAPIRARANQLAHARALRLELEHRQALLAELQRLQDAGAVFADLTACLDRFAAL